MNERERELRRMTQEFLARSGGGDARKREESEMADLDRTTEGNARIRVVESEAAAPTRSTG